MSDDEDRQHAESYRTAIRDARLAGADTFQSWFNESKDERTASVRGFWDFTFHILTRGVCARLASPETSTALEIGYGGGRLLRAAACHFREVIGIDVHDEAEAVAAHLGAQGVANFQLLQTTGRAIPVPDRSVDLVYSFIVLQHLPSVSALTAYVQEAHRCLKSGGVAQLYFGRFGTLAFGVQLRHALAGYKEIHDAPVNHTSLVVREGFAKRLCRDAGFAVLDSGVSYKRAPDGYPASAGGQFYLTLGKS